ncbi:MAG: BolA family protein [Gammaproteobacteria bacterium]
MSERVEMIKACLNEALSPEHLEIIDESHKHAGHAGAASGGGHFDALIVAEAFSGKRLLERHRMVYAALGDMMNREIHAFSMQCKSPDEV